MTAAGIHHRRKKLIVLFLILSFTVIFCSRFSLETQEIETTPQEAAPTVGADTSEPAGSETNLIIYQGLDGNIYTTDPEGDVIVAITDDADLSGTDGDSLAYRFPIWAPDSQNIGYSSIAGSVSNGPTAAIFTASSDGDDRIAVFTSTTAFPIYLYWTPDNRNISFLTNNTGSADNLEALTPSKGVNGLMAPLLQQSGLALQWVAADGSSPARALDFGQPYYWSFSPDGKQFLAHVGGAAFMNPEARLAILSTEDNLITELAVSPSLFRAPAWSPNGEDLLFVTFDADSGKSELVVTNIDGLGSLSLAEVTNASAFSWSPDGTHVALVVNEQFIVQETLGELLVIDAADPAKFTQVEEENVVAYYWAPNGEKIAYFTFRTEISSGNETFEFAINVLNIETLEIQTHAYTPTREFIRTVVPFFDQYHHSTTIWSPDSTKIVISGVENGTSRIFVFDVGGEINPQPVAEGVLAFWSWR